MAHVDKNIVTQGLSGKIGTLVYRQRAGKTVATAAIDEWTHEGTPEQHVRRTKFQQAVLYGQKVNADPSAKQEYKGAAREGQSAYNIAIADFMNAPDISEIDISAYTGLAGQYIRIKVTDDFKVRSVILTIKNEDGTLVEEGNAVPEHETGTDWIYTTLAENANLTGDKITVTATDTPANLSVEERTL